MNSLCRRVFSIFLICFFHFGVASPLSACHLHRHPGPNYGAPSGCFVFYRLALTWQPEFCRIHSKRYRRCQQWVKTHGQLSWGVHGLWPSDGAVLKGISYPVYCSGSPGCLGQHACRLQSVRLTRQLMQQLHRIIPVRPKRLIKRQWEKHGTCAGVSQDQYLSQLIQVYQQHVKSLPSLYHVAQPLTVSALAKYLSLTGFAHFYCRWDKVQRRYFLTEMDLTLNKKMALIAGQAPRRHRCPRGQLIYIRLWA